MILYGKITNVQSVKDWVKVAVSRPGRKGADGAPASDEQIMVWYNKDRAGNILEKTSALIGEERMMLVSHVEVNSEERYYGIVPPMSYGFVKSTPELIIGVSEETIEDAVKAIEDCEDAGELPAEVSVDYTSADSMASIIAMLASSRSSVATAAKRALWKIVATEQNGYLGRIGGAWNNGDKIKITFKTPSKLDANGNPSPEEWNTVTFFKEQAEFLQKLNLQKGDKVFMTMGEKDYYNGKPSYKGIALKKL